jgi:rRNA maturation endonuclease Nob1
MKTSKETGHSNQVANFSTLISLVKQSEKVYNPSHAKLKVDEMEKLRDEATAILEDFVDKQAHHTMLVTAKTKAFDDLPKYITRIYRSVEICDVNESVLKDVKGIVKQFRHKAPAKAKTAAAGSDTSSTEETKSDGRGKKALNAHNQLESLLKLTELIGEIEQYESNDEDLKLDGIKSYYQDLKKLNAELESSKIEIESIRMKRDYLLFTDPYSMVNIAKKVKLYFKSIFKADSKELKQINNLKFRKPGKAA